MESGGKRAENARSDTRSPYRQRGTQVDQIYGYYRTGFAHATEGGLDSHFGKGHDGERKKEHRRKRSLRMGYRYREIRVEAVYRAEVRLVKNPYGWNGQRHKVSFELVKS